MDSKVRMFGVIIYKYDINNYFLSKINIFVPKILDHYILYVNTFVNINRITLKFQYYRR